MKHSLQLKLSQHLTLTPQLQQSIRLLQLSTLELNQEIERFLQENPLLEREEDEESPATPAAPGQEAAITTTSSTTETSSQETQESQPQSDWSGEEGYTSYGNPESDDDDSEPPLAAGSATLREHLLGQLSLMPLSERDTQLVAYLIDNLNDDGFIQDDLGELAGLLPEELEIDSDDLSIALKYLQSLEPAGVGARNIGECLALQIEALPEDTPYRAQALQVVRENLDTLALRDYTKLKKILRCDDDTLRNIQSLITHLNPRPAANYTGSEARYVVADVIVKKVKGMWVASLNPDAMPKLRVNRMYADILHRNRDASLQQLSGQLRGTLRAPRQALSRRRPDRRRASRWPG